MEVSAGVHHARNDAALARTCSLAFLRFAG